MSHPIGSEARRGGSARNAAAVPLSTLHVVQEDEHWAVQCGALEQRLQLLQPPVALLGSRPEAAEPGTIQQGWRPVEERPEQRRKLSHRL